MGSRESISRPILTIVGPLQAAFQRTILRRGAATKISAAFLGRPLAASP
jgi:hypothetical protein